MGLGLRGSYVGGQDVFEQDVMRFESCSTGLQPSFRDCAAQVWSLFLDSSMEQTWKWQWPPGNEQSLQDPQGGTLKLNR